MASNRLMVEPNIGGYSPPEPFGFENGSAVHQIMRLITGSVNVKNTETNRITCLSKNELRLQTKRSARPERLVADLFDGEVALDDYRLFVVSASRRNYSFFNKVKDELALCLICKKEGRLTESFLYLYRILEFVSVAFPFLYASIQKDFNKSHEFLKSLVSDQDAGELKVLTNALPTLVEGTLLADIKFDFSVSGCDTAFVAMFKSQIRSKVVNKVKDVEFEDEGDILFRVPFLSMPSFFVSLRNRMFHYKAGQSNLDLGMLGGADRVLSICLGELVYWFALTFSEIVRTLAKQDIRVVPS